MLYFTGQKTVSAIKRQVYVNNISSATTVGTTTCYLRPLSEVEVGYNAQYGIPYNAIFEPEVDVRELDILTIEGVDYTVKGVSLHDRGSFTQYLKALIVRPEL